MYQFRISIHARPERGVQSYPVRLADTVFEALEVDPAGRVGPMSVSFEEAVQRLEKLPRLFIEPDGAFVWAGSQGDVSWQIDGCLYDHNHHMVYVDLAGSCPREQFDHILGALDWPDAQLMFQLSRHGLFLGETQFRKYVAQKSVNRAVNDD